MKEKFAKVIRWLFSGFLMFVATLPALVSLASAGEIVNKQWCRHEALTCSDDNGKTYFLTWTSLEVKAREGKRPTATLTDTKGGRHSLRWNEQESDECVVHCLVEG